jgi:hypothetical protein
MDNKLKNGVEVDSPDETWQLSTADRTSVVLFSFLTFNFWFLAAS